MIQRSSESDTHHICCLAGELNLVKKKWPVNQK